MRAGPAPRLPLICLAAAAALLSACSLVRSPVRAPAPPPPPAQVERVPDAIPRPEPRSATGNPPYYDALGKRYYVMASADGYAETGVASWYGPDFQAKRTSSGEVYDMYAMTAAHKTLPLPTYARVTNLSNGRSVVVRINDRGPFVANRIIDLSYTAAAKLDMLRNGTAVVEVRALKAGQPLPPVPLLQASQPPPAAPPASPSPAPSSEPPRVMPLAAIVPVPAPATSESEPKGEPPPGATTADAAAGAAAAAPLPAAAQDNAVPLPSEEPAPEAAAGAAPGPAAAHAKAFYLQAGAFSNPQNAQAVLTRLRNAGIPQAFVLEPAGGGSTLFRVRVGPLASVDDIDRVAERLTTLGFADARVISDLAP